MTKNKFVHIEFPCRDLEKSKIFYSGLFNWKFQRLRDDYILFLIDDVMGGGLVKVDDIPGYNFPRVYIRVKDIKSTGEKILKLGGALERDIIKLPDGMGKEGLFRDIDGNIFGLWQAS